MINLEGVRISDLSEPLGKFPCNRLCWGSIFVLFPYFVYIAHLTKFTRRSSLLEKHQQSPRNFESCLSMHCLAPQQIFRFFHFCRGFFSSAIGNFSYYCVVLSTLHIKMLFSSLGSVRIGKNCARSLGYRPRPQAMGGT